MRVSALANGGADLLLPPPALAERRHRSLARGLERWCVTHWNSVFSVAPEQALGPPGKGPGRYLPFRIVERRHLGSAVKSRMDAQY